MPFYLLVISLWLPVISSTFYIHSLKKVTWFRSCEIPRTSVQLTSFLELPNIIFNRIVPNQSYFPPKCCWHQILLLLQCWQKVLILFKPTLMIIWNFDFNVVFCFRYNAKSQVAYFTRLFNPHWHLAPWDLENRIR